MMSLHVRLVCSLKFVKFFRFRGTAALPKMSEGLVLDLDLDKGRKKSHIGWFIECMKQLGLLKLIVSSKIECRHKLLTPDFFKVSLKI